ncbi:MAG: ABC transporter permease [Acidobacteria bacterium]|nr:ABC transporter permease [Acidobacteriota bacterium]
MDWREAVGIATASLWAHKLRSVLTLLGVVIGVTCVIVVISLINGANSYIAEKVFTLGADVFILQKSPAIITNIDDFLEAQKRRKITRDDYESVRELCRSCVDVAATLYRRADVKFGMNYVKDSSVRGYTPSLFRISDLEVQSGRFITEGDEARAAPVCVIGWDIVDNLFVGIDPIGRELRVDGDTYQIVGVAKKQGSALGQSRDNWVAIPFRAYQKAYGAEQSVRIWGKANGPERLDQTMDEIRQIMRGRRHVPYSAKDDFHIDTNQSFLTLWSSISGAFFGVTVAIASVSLVVGGIVIMNIMLVSVTERTREIGLRKSLGARRHDILVQFLVESSTIAAVGGMGGVLLGILIATIVSWITPLPSAIKLWAILAGLFVSTSVGLFFGIYPASKASRLDPVVALRSE